MVNVRGEGWPLRVFTLKLSLTVKEERDRGSWPRASGPKRRTTKTLAWSERRLNDRCDHTGRSARTILLSRVTYQC